MTEQALWLLAFGALLAAWCLYWGITEGPASRRIDDYFLAGRDTPAWLFVLSATALSVTGWLAIGHPAMVFADGFAFAEAALGAVAIPLAGIVFLKRQWLLARRFGYATPASMFGAYYSSELLRLLVLLIALVFAVPFVGMQLAASAQLIERMSDGLVDRHGAMWIVGFAIFVYVYLGGMRALTAAGALQCLLMLAGMVGLGCIAYAKLGGFGAFNAALASFGTEPAAAKLFEIPGVIQFTAGLGKETPVGGIWTASMILSYALALMGIQASPSFSMLAFASRDTQGFAAQQVWATGAIVGLVLVLFALAQGMGVHLSGTTLAAGTADPTVSLLLSVGAGQPWLAALLAICLVAAIQLAAAAYVWTTAAMLTSDFCVRYCAPRADERRQRIFARTALGLMLGIALAMATYTPLALVQVGALALSFALQLWPVLAGVCWLPWVTRQGAVVGLAAGLIAVVLTEPVAGSVARLFGFEIPWGRWPWTIHSAGWGIFCNVLVCALVSFATRGGPARRLRDEHHRFLREHDALPPRKRVMRPAVWALTLAWIFFALGPGAVIGNDLFGAPAGGLQAWKLGIPSLWAWQIIWWALGVFVIWWLAYKMELATAPHAAVARPRRPDDNAG